MPEAWEIFSNHLYFAHHAFGLKIHCFVLMNNHFHLIASTPNANLDEVMNYFMRETSRLITWESERINQTYGGPYSWSLIRCTHNYLLAYKYLYRNPSEAGLVEKVEEYRYSTLRTLLGQEHSIIPLELDEFLFENVEYCIDWLNIPYPDEDIKKEIEAALRKREFKFGKDRNRKPSKLNSQLF